MSKENSHDTAQPGLAAKLGFFALITVVVSSMLGGGVYSLPQNTAAASAAGPVIIAWLIVGFCVYFIANSFRILSDIRPDLKAGVYMYAREGFGRFIGFITAWGYWLMTIFGNVAFAVILMDALDYFFPGVFTGGNNFNSIIGGSILIWFYYFLVLSGVKRASLVNLIGTFSNMLPIFLFIVVLLFAIRAFHFDANFWGNSAAIRTRDLGSVGAQIKAPMLVALWCFIGVEGAVVLSGRARNQRDVGKATTVGFLVALCIYMLLSILPFGITSQHTLEGIPNPSTAGVLAIVVGKWGEWLMNCGLIVSVLTSWIAWTLLCAEIPMAAGENGTFPKGFSKTNKNGTAGIGLLVSTVIMQIAMLVVYFANNAWQAMYSVSSLVMLPAYLTTTLFLFKLCRNGEYRKYAAKGIALATVSGIIGFLFCLFMFYAGGINYVAMIPVLLSVGVPLFVWARREQIAQGDTDPIFLPFEKWCLGILLALDVLAIALVASGVITL
ncbi:MAG: basic amino acid/polyamine antiporter [Victivallaceae bacterium]|nr:basic amino acid/polyamine antiporter [Victivallaceae bacterium]